MLEYDRGPVLTTNHRYAHQDDLFNVPLKHQTPRTILIRKRQRRPRKVRHHGHEPWTADALCWLEQQHPTSAVGSSRPLDIAQQSESQPSIFQKVRYCNAPALLECITDVQNDRQRASRACEVCRKPFPLYRVQAEAPRMLKRVDC